MALSRKAVFVRCCLKYEIRICVKEVILMSMLWVWVIVIAAAVLFEATSPIQLVSIWAALGGLVSLILCLCNVDMAIQIIVFFAVTILAIILTRPLAKKMTGFRKTATNADMNIGKVGRVTKIVDEQLGIFRVRVENNDWSATTENKQVLPVDSEITVLRIEGVKLIVAPVKKTVIVKS